MKKCERPGCPNTARKRWCSDACKMAAWNAKHYLPATRAGEREADPRDGMGFLRPRLNPITARRLRVLRAVKYPALNLSGVIAVLIGDAYEKPQSEA